jgi:hypothetical protein
VVFRGLLPLRKVPSELRFVKDRTVLGSDALEFRTKFQYSTRTGGAPGASPCARSITFGDGAYGLFGAREAWAKCADQRVSCYRSVPLADL